MAQNIKKTMQPVLEFVTKYGKMTPENLEQFTNEFCIAKSGTTSTGPREVTILRDVEGNQLGRKCSVTGLWFDNSHFSKNTTCVKAADKARGLRHVEARKMIKDAETILAEAKDITDIAGKVAKYEEYDAKLAEANAHRKADIAITDEMKKGGVETIEDLAKSLKVPVITAQPKKEDEAQ